MEGGIELLRESLEAKGHLDALGSLSEDEGLLEEGESDCDNSEGEEREEEAVTEKQEEEEDDNDIFGHEEGEGDEENRGVAMKESGGERREESQQRSVSIYCRYVFVT